MDKEPTITKHEDMHIFLHCRIESKENANIETCKKCCMFKNCKILNSPEKENTMSNIIVSNKDINNLMRRLKK